jgi:hypothetical protein
MQAACWKAGPGNRYWMDANLGGHSLPVMIDVGLVDPRGRVGFEIEPLMYDRLKASGQFSTFRWRGRRDASGRTAWSPSGLTIAQIVAPLTGQPIGPRVRLYVSRGDAGVPSRVGVVFFHLLRGCRVLWDLDQRLWCIECP